MKVFIALGSNMGDRLAHLREGIRHIAGTSGIRLINESPVYDTPPLYNTDQDHFYNQVISVSTDLEPSTILETLQRIESDAGRKPSAKRNTPRPLDLDILAADDRRIDEPAITIPHPRLNERRFVLQPWSDIDSGFTVPGFDQSVSQLLDNCRDDSRIQQITVNDTSEIA